MHSFPLILIYKNLEKCNNGAQCGAWIKARIKESIANILLLADSILLFYVAALQLRSSMESRAQQLRRAQQGWIVAP